MFSVTVVKLDNIHAMFNHGDWLRLGEILRMDVYGFYNAATVMVTVNGSQLIDCCRLN